MIFTLIIFSDSKHVEQIPSFFSLANNLQRVTRIGEDRGGHPRTLAQLGRAGGRVLSGVLQLADDRKQSRFFFFTDEPSNRTIDFGGTIPCMLQIAYRIEIPPEVLGMCLRCQEALSDREPNTCLEMFSRSAANSTRSGHRARFFYVIKVTPSP